MTRTFEWGRQITGTISVGDPDENGDIQLFSPPEAVAKYLIRLGYLFHGGDGQCAGLNCEGMPWLWCHRCLVGWGHLNGDNRMSCWNCKSTTRVERNQP